MIGRRLLVRSEDLLGARPEAHAVAKLKPRPRAFYARAFLGSATIPSMAVPGRQTIMRPLLELLADGGERTPDELITAGFAQLQLMTSLFPWLSSIALLAALSGSAGCDLCGNEVLARHPAPDNSVEVVVFQRSCGATTGFSTQASIQELNAGSTNGPGDIFAATTDRGATPPGKGGGPELRVRWIDDRTLELAHHKRASVSYGRTSFRGITIRYVTFE